VRVVRASGNEFNYQEENVMSNNSTNVIPFNFGKQQVRALLIDGQSWFVAKDVIASLEYAKSSNAARVVDHVPDQWKGVNPIHTLGGNQQVLMLSEQGLYFFIGRSDKPKALPFQMWLAGEVLPAIRKHGRYEDGEGKMQTLIGQTIGTDGFHMLGAIVKGKVSSLPVPAQRRATAKIWSQTHAAFGVRSAADIPADQLDAARNFIAAYVVQEGEFLPKDSTSHSNTLTDRELYDVFFVMHHFSAVKRIYDSYQLAAAFRMLRSPAGAEMVDHFRDSTLAMTTLSKRLPDMEAAAVRIGMDPGTVMRSAA
jgi:prophage antirepressor-like protein